MWHDIRKRTHRERQWWWNEDVQKAVEEKKKSFKLWQRTKNEEDRETYQVKKREAKRQVAQARRIVLEEWSQNLNTTEGRNKMFKIAKSMRKDRKDVKGAKYIKDENGEIKIKEEDIMSRWKQYFEKLLNECNEYDLEDVSRTEGPIENVTTGEVRGSLKKMKNGKAPGPSGITSDLLKAGGEPVIEELHRIYENIMKEEQGAKEWEESLTAVVFKGKGDALECGNYRGIRLLEHSMKVWEKILEERLRKIVKINKCQFGFMPGKSTTEAIFVMRQLQEKYRKKRKRLYHIFVDLEKAFDRIPRAAIRWALRRQRVPERLITQVMALYSGARSRVRTIAGLSEEFEMRVGVHQGSALSPLLFIIVMEEATKECRKGGPWELLYADDLVLTAETKEEVIEMFKQWRRGMEKRGLKINMNKTKYLVTGKEAKEKVQCGKWPCGCCGKGVGTNSILCCECNRWCHKKCSGLRNLGGVVDFRCPACVRRANREYVEEEPCVIEEGQTLEEAEYFCYLGSILDCEGGVERAVRARVAAAWTKWRDIAGLLVNKNIPLVNRSRVYDSCIRPVLLYGAETWALTQKLEEIVKRCDNRMLRFMAGVRWEDHLTNDDVAEMCGIEKLEYKLRAQRLRWFGHVVRAEEEQIVREVFEMEVMGPRPVGRPRKSWRKCIDEELDRLGIRAECAQDRREWRTLIRRLTPQRENLT